MARLRVLTMNLLYGRADAEMLAELVLARRIDVVALQELGNEQARRIATLLPHGKLVPNEEGSGSGIALRGESQVQCLSLGGRSVWVARLDPAHWPELGRPLEVIAAHLTSPLEGSLRGARTLRRQQVEGMEAYLRRAGPLPRILLGDLNATPVWPLYRRLATLFEDAAVTVARRHGRWPVRTWGPTSGSPRLLRIDHVLVDGVRPERLDVIRVPGSDHSAVVCELAIP